MPPENLQEALDRQPFEPFRIHLSDGKTYDIRHPALLMVDRRSAVVGIAEGDPDQPFYGRYAIIALLHIVRVGPLGRRRPRGD